MKDIIEFLKGITFHLALLIFISTLLIISLPPSSWPEFLSFKAPHQKLIEKYSVELFLSLIVSIVLIIFSASIRIFKYYIHPFLLSKIGWYRGKKRKIWIINGTYGASSTPANVTNILKELVQKSEKKDSVKVEVNDPIFLKYRKEDDDMPGSKKILRIEYLYWHSKEYSQGQILEI